MSLIRDLKGRFASDEDAPLTARQKRKFARQDRRDAKIAETAGDLAVRANRSWKFKTGVLAFGAANLFLVKEGVQSLILGNPAAEVSGLAGPQDQKKLGCVVLDGSELGYSQIVAGAIDDAGTSYIISTNREGGESPEEVMGNDSDVAVAIQKTILVPELNEDGTPKVDGNGVAITKEIPTEGPLLSLDEKGTDVNKIIADADETIGGVSAKTVALGRSANGKFDVQSTCETSVVIIPRGGNGNVPSSEEGSIGVEPPVRVLAGP